MKRGLWIILTLMLCGLLALPAGVWADVSKGVNWKENKGQWYFKLDPKRQNLSLQDDAEYYLITFVKADYEGDYHWIAVDQSGKLSLEELTEQYGGNGGAITGVPAERVGVELFEGVDGEWRLLHEIWDWNKTTGNTFTAAIRESTSQTKEEHPKGRADSAESGVGTESEEEARIPTPDMMYIRLTQEIGQTKVILPIEMAEELYGISVDFDDDGTLTVRTPESDEEGLFGAELRCFIRVEEEKTDSITLEEYPAKYHTETPSAETYHRVPTPTEQPTPEPISALTQGSTSDPTQELTPEPTTVLTQKPTPEPTIVLTQKPTPESTSVLAEENIAAGSDAERAEEMPETPLDPEEAVAADSNESEAESVAEAESQNGNSKPESVTAESEESEAESAAEAESQNGNSEPESVTAESEESEAESAASPAADEESDSPGAESGVSPVEVGTDAEPAENTSMIFSRDPNHLFRFFEGQSNMGLQVGLFAIAFVLLTFSKHLLKQETRLSDSRRAQSTAPEEDDEDEATIEPEKLHKRK